MLKSTFIREAIPRKNLLLFGHCHNRLDPSPDFLWKSSLFWTVHSSPPFTSKLGWTMSTPNLLWFCWLCMKITFIGLLLMTFLALLKAEFVSTDGLVLVHDFDNANGKECDMLLIQYAVWVVQYAMCIVKYAMLGVTGSLQLHKKKVFFVSGLKLFFLPGTFCSSRSKAILYWTLKLKFIFVFNNNFS